MFSELAHGLPCDVSCALEKNVCPDPLRYDVLCVRQVSLFYSVLVVPVASGVLTSLSVAVEPPFPFGSVHETGF